MIRLTKKADYAVFIMSFVARQAARPGGTADDGRRALLSAQELSSFSPLNKSLVANLLKDLARAGLLDSVRGARGGYRLARSAAEISLAEILFAVDGPLALVDCVHETERAIAASGPGPVIQPCPLGPMCSSRGPMLVLNDRIAQLLSDLRLDELSGLKSPGQSPFGQSPFEQSLRAEEITR